MRHYLLYEDELPPKLLVIFSKEIADKIESIDSYNHLNETSLEQWRDYLEGLINWLSNPVIAWDYLNRYQHDSDGTTHIVDIGYDVTFIIKENKEGKNYIDILAMKFNLEEYGLELPPNLQENTLKNNQNKTYKTMNRIRLTESQLHNEIRKCINEATRDYKLPGDETITDNDAVGVDGKWKRGLRMNLDGVKNQLMIICNGGFDDMYEINKVLKRTIKDIERIENTWLPVD